MRAVAENKPVASLMGIDVDSVISRTFIISGALAGAAGVMWGIHLGLVYFFVGFVPGIKAFTAAVLGGIGNIPGAMLGGLFLGMVEALGPAVLVNFQLKDVIAFGILVLVLIFRPTGILGEVFCEDKVMKTNYATTSRPDRLRDRHDLPVPDRVDRHSSRLIGKALTRQLHRHSSADMLNLMFFLGLMGLWLARWRPAKGSDGSGMNVVLKAALAGFITGIMLAALYSCWERSDRGRRHLEHVPGPISAEPCMHSCMGWLPQAASLTGFLYDQGALGGFSYSGPDGSAPGLAPASGAGPLPAAARLTDDPHHPEP